VSADSLNGLKQSRMASGRDQSPRLATLTPGRIQKFTPERKNRNRNPFPNTH
jgi:hypothetical protein